MVRRLFKNIATPVRGLVMKPIRSLHQAAYLLAGLTLASQLLALLRDRTFAHTFGAGQTLDFYYAAFRVPDLVFALVSSLVSAYIIIPRITGMDKDKTKEFLSESATFLLGMGGLICLVLAIFMPQFLTFLYPDLMALPDQGAFVLLTRILLIQPIMLGLSGVLGSVTQVHRRFVIFALSPVLYNLSIILGTIGLYPYFGIVGIGVGVLVGSILYLAVNLPVLLDAGVMPTFRWPSFKLMVPIVRASMPRSLALGMNSVTILVLTSMASRLGTGSVSVFTFAGNLEAVPLALIGSSYAVAAFPALSEALVAHDRREFNRILSAGARHIILWSMVGLGLIVVLRAHIVRVVLGTGAFNWNDTRLTAALLAVLTVGLAVDALELLFSRALYAARQSWRPLLYQVATAVFTVMLAVFLLTLPAAKFLTPLASLLKVGDVPGTAILLLALANIIGQFFLVFLSLIALRGVAPGFSRTLVRPIIDGFIAAIAGGMAAYLILLLEGGIAPLTTLTAVFTQGLFAGIVGITAAALALYLTENKEFRIVMNALLKLVRSRRTDALTPSAEEPIQQ